MESMMMMFGVLFVLSIQPMLVISSLISIVLMYSFYLYWNLSGFWFSYMMVLVLMSGVLVVFTYMMSVLPNESFEISSLVLFIFGAMMLYNSNVYNEFIQDMSLGSMKIWGGISLVSSLFLILYLLFIMVLVVWISMLEQGAIRII